MQLSKRLTRVAAFVTEGNRLADIGTDHGYIPIYLVKKGICPSAYAMDIGKGPLERANEHILAENLQDKIETRLSNGLEKLYDNEADTVLIAGMGGGLVIDILERGRKVLKTVKELVLSPHSEWYEVREYLTHNGYTIVKEDMLIDADKYYIILKVEKGQCEKYSMIELKYGKHLLEGSNEVLNQYLLKEKNKYLEILSNLEKQNSNKVNVRIGEIKKELEYINEALLRYSIQ